jgi:hypothetical protein
MLLRWLPWKYIVRRAARAYGVVDPIQLLARLRAFSQPSEVQEPVELLRAGIVLQARGMINTRILQFNLDWIWPLWVQKQFNPNSRSFIPRAHSFSHINLTQRNWTAVGHPYLPVYPIVDPHGLVTPLHDGWSLDFWLLSDDGRHILPSKMDNVRQTLRMHPELTVETRAGWADSSIQSSAWIDYQGNEPFLYIRAACHSKAGGRFVVALRPCNPEGVSFIKSIRFDAQLNALIVDQRTKIYMSATPSQTAFSNFRGGDVFHTIAERPSYSARKAHCSLGLATGAAIFNVPPEMDQDIEVSIPLQSEIQRTFPGRARVQPIGWDAFLAPVCKVALPDPKYQFIFDSAVRTLSILSANDIYPGPFSYRRFWFRDACLMIHAMLNLNMIARSRRLLHRFPIKQRIDGFFHSQAGEWDSNGQVLWIMDYFQRASGEKLPEEWLKAVDKGARWIIRKRLPKTSGKPHAGLLPAGFSAEHFGPNDFYFWDDFWAVAGLRSAARLMRLHTMTPSAARLEREAADLQRTIDSCITSIPFSHSRGGIPASPYRRMDAGAIGVLVADYPLRLRPPRDPRIWSTLEFLLDHCSFNGGFFQDMIHSGINIYLTLDMAQTLLRGEDQRYRRLLRVAAEMASDTGNWPEAVHPFSGGGCMGDGQHGWAAAEWVMMIRHLFVREESEHLILGSGLLPQWLQQEDPLYLGPTPTSYGPLRIEFKPAGPKLRMRLKADWNAQAPILKINPPGFRPQQVGDAPKEIEVVLEPLGSEIAAGQQ